jgi:hypothetical protein
MLEGAERIMGGKLIPRQTGALLHEQRACTMLQTC